MQKILGNFWGKKSQDQQNKLGVLGKNNEKVEEVEVNGQKVKIPKEHANASLEEQENCPFMKMQKQKELDDQLVDTEAVMPFQKKEKMPKGGCPFMPSENKKNPPLQLDLDLKYDMKYISPKNYLINCKGFSLFPNKKNLKNRKIYEQYPIYLKHTMFHQDQPLMLKARKSEVTQKFFIFDQFREKGNKFLKKKDYEMALNCYEHALSVVRWVELLDEDDIEYEKEIKKQQIENVKKREEEEEKQKIEEKKKNLIKKTKKGAKLQSINSIQRQKQRDEEIKQEIEEMGEDSDSISNSDEIEPIEGEQERLKRQAEQEEAQKRLYEKARQQIQNSSLPNSQNQDSNNSNDDTNEETKEENNNSISDCASLDRGVRSDDDFDLSDENLEESKEEQKEEQKEDSESDSDKKRLRNILKQKKEEKKQKEENLRNKTYLREKVENSDFEDNRSDIAIGDEEDLQERKAELDRENRDERKKQEKLKELIKEYELEDNQEDDEDYEEDEEDEEESKNEKTKIKMDKNDLSEAQLEKMRIQREKKAKDILELEEEDKEFKKKYKLFLSDFNDENTRYFDGEDLKDAHDIDMRQGMLLTILTGIAIVYLKLGHYTNAVEALEDADKVAQMKSSQIYFRKVQAYCYNKSASLQELIKAKQDIILALKIKSTEKMFKQEKGILKILNLSDHEEAYQSLAIEITDRIHKKREENTEKITNLLERAAEIEEIYQEMIIDGRKKVGDEDDEQEDEKWSLDKEGKKFEGKELQIFEKIKELEENKEKEITKIILDKHYSMVDFYMEQMKIEKVRGAQEELQKALHIQHEMDFYYNLDLSEKTQDSIVQEVNKETKVEFGLQRVQKRLEKLKKEYAKDIYEQGNFNFYILQYAIKEYFKKVYNLKNRLEQLQEERMKLKKDKKNKKNQNQKPGSSNPLSLTNIFSPQGVFQIAFLLFIIILLLSFFNSDLGKNLNIEQIIYQSFGKFSFK